MESFKLIAAILGIIAVIYLLVKKNETRTVLIGVGLVLCIVSLQPMSALNEFAKLMTSAGLIMAICSSMGFAFVMKFTRCDMHLVKALTAPMRGLGFFLIPVASALTFGVNIAIPSAAGCSAAVGATLIPILIASGVRPAMAAAAVFSGTFGGMISPGAAHNSFVANLVAKTEGLPSYDIQKVIAVHAPYTVIAGIISATTLIFIALLFKDYQKPSKSNGVQSVSVAANGGEKTEITQVKPLMVIAPLVPLLILIVGGTPLSELYSWLAWTKMGVPQAMLIGAIYAIIVTLSKPAHITNEFFKGMGSAYTEVMGIIIAASVFVVGLKATGAVDYAIDFLKNAQHFVRWGATLGPFLMAVVTGSGDAAAMAFNGAVTPHAAELGYQQVNLGMAAAISGALGRTMSPIAGAAIVCASIAGISPVEMVKRTAPGVIIAVLFIALFML